MGWLNRKQRREVRKKFHARASYLCDVCDNPIPVGALIVIDPRKGYFSWPEDTPLSFRPLSGRQPRWTSCYSCDKERREARITKRQRRRVKFLRAVDRVLEMIDKKPKRGYWTRKKCVKRMEGKIERRLVLRAITLLMKERTLKKREGGYLVR